MKNLFITLFTLISTAFHAQSNEIGFSFVNSLLVEKNYPKAYDFFDETVKEKI